MNEPALDRLLERLRTLIGRALARTAALWPDVRETHRWLRAAAHILANAAGLAAVAVQARYDRLLAAWTARRDQAGTLGLAVDHFLKVTASYRPGLFHAYAVPGLPRTDNDLEHLFGAHRYHERRTTGRKVASPSLVLRGSVRIVAAALTRMRPVPASELAEADRTRWRDLKAAIEARRQARLARRRFRRNHNAFLADLETRAGQLRLPT